MNDVVIPKLSRIAVVDAIVAAQLDGGSLRLYQNDITPSVDSILTDFTVATFTGYANKTIATWGATYVDVNDKATTVAPLQTFAATAATVGNTVYGCYYLDSGGALVWAARFDEQWTFQDTGDTYNMVPKYQFGDLET